MAAVAAAQSAAPSGVVEVWVSGFCRTASTSCGLPATKPPLTPKALPKVPMSTSTAPPPRSSGPPPAAAEAARPRRHRPPAARRTAAAGPARGLAEGADAPAAGPAAVLLGAAPGGAVGADAVRI